MSQPTPSPSESADLPDEGPRVPPWVRRALIALGVLLLLLVAAALGARAYFTPDRLASMVVPRVQDRVGREVRISSVRLKLLPRPAVRLEDVALAAGAGLGPEPALEGEAVDLQLALMPLLGGRVSVTRLRLVAPTLRWRVAAEGGHSFSGLGGERAAAAENGEGGRGDGDGRALPVSEVEVERATVVYDDRRSGRGARFRADGAFAASREPGAPGVIASRGELRVDSLRAVTSGSAGDSIGIGPLRLTYEASLAATEDSLALRSLELETEGLRATGSGSLAWGGGPPRLDLRLETGEADVGALLRLVSGSRPERAAEGTVRATLRVRGPLGGNAAPRVEGTARLRDVRLADSGGEPLVSDLNAQAALSGDSLRISSFEGTVRGRPLRGEAPLVRFSGGRLDVEGLTVRVGDSDLTLTADAADLFPLSRLDRDAGTGPRPALDFRLASDRLDLDRLRGLPADADTALAYARLLKAHLSGSRVDGRSAGEVAAERYPLPELPRLDARGRVRVGELVLAETRMEDVRFDVRLEDGRLRLEGVEAGLHGGRLTGGLTAETGAEGRRWPVDYDLQLRGADAAELTDRWTKLGRALTGALDVTVAGRTDLDRSFLPVTERTEARGRVTVTEGSAEEMVPMQGVMNALGLPPARIARFDSLGGPFRVRGGRVELEDWRLRSRSGARGRMAGTVSFAGPLDLDLTLSLPLALLEGSRLAKLAGGEQGGLGRLLGGAAGSDRVIDVPVAVGGTMSKPAVKVLEKVLTDRLDDLLQRKGSDLLRGLFERPKKDEEGGGGGR